MPWGDLAMLSHPEKSDVLKAGKERPRFYVNRGRWVEMSCLYFGEKSFLKYLREI